MNQQIKEIKKEKFKFFISTFAGACSTGIFFYSINNFLVDIYGVTADQRGVIEFFREMPGMLLFLFIAPFSGFRETRILAAALAVVAAGIMGCAFSPDVFMVTLWLFVWSIGAHFAITLRESFCVALSSREDRGRIFGFVRSLRSLGTVVGASVIWAGMEYCHAGYRELYILAALSAMFAVAATLLMKDTAHTGLKRKAFLLKKRYSLFYLLAILFGVRKQLFLVFGPWILIKVFHQDAPQMAKLAIASALVGFFVKPWLGRAIDRFGERKTLMADATVLFCICTVYALAERVFPSAVVLPALFLCYILDDCLFSLRSAHVTYLSKIVESPDELTVSISTSYSIEHVVSMLAPPVAGVVWIMYGYPWVFGFAAMVAVAMFFVSSRLPGGGN